MAHNRMQTLVILRVHIIPEALKIDRHTRPRRIGKIFIKGAGYIRRKRKRRISRHAMIDVIAQRKRKHQRRIPGVFCYRLLNLRKSPIRRIHRHFEHNIGRAMKTQRSVLNIEIDHLRPSNMTQKYLVLLTPHGRYIGKTIVLMHRLRIRVRRIEATCENVHHRHRMPVTKPARNR